jgi:hypothetical protein
MPDLISLQTRMADALLHGRFAALGDQIVAGPVAAQEALGLHRNTVLCALSNALRLTFPTAEALVGEAFFDQAALAFVAVHPPARACLTGYGADFPAFLETYAPATDIPYLVDVARLDAVVEEVGALSVGADGGVIDLGQMLLTLDASIRLLDLTYPAAAIRDAIETGDDAALGAVDLAPGRYRRVLWRVPAGAAIRPLGPAAFAFLAALLDGAAPDTALKAALAEGADLIALQTEIFSAPFARLTMSPTLETDR